ncbi:3-isopropylmalate dehydrogenase [Sphingomonas kaistensis]|uniref:3-isopropylmalate dehydrogenase n=1 Tax=Sphingomonas kaistensis TaxID=298708 RepID=A0A7X5Y7I8_9SPHN|nr:3-isopropylmalate dehydrogenase [Sphingomonas kaistensis]NJC06612.1 3-isopropylmalate dehydrogenase [Sphingomonas kaistensis]
MIHIAVLPGDGIGPEVTREAVACLELLSAERQLGLHFTEHDFGGVAIDRHSEPLPPSTLAACKKADAILLGAVGGDRWNDCAERPEAGLLKIRQELGLYANLRPVEVLQGGQWSPLRSEVASGSDILVVRELTGGIYYGGHRLSEDQASDLCTYTRAQVERVAHVAFRAARLRKGKVTQVDKANVLATSRLWRATVDEVAKAYPDVALDHLYVDACAMAVITEPRRFDVILTENLFGDILSDLLSVIGGSIGLLGSASLGSGGPGLFEPVHGSAPQIAGLDIANPAGAIASAAMMLDELGLGDAGSVLREALEATLLSGCRTPDLGGDASTSGFGAAVRERLQVRSRRDTGLRHLFLTNRGCCG